MPTIYGDLVDQMTRCTDYSKDTDIIALRCFSCRKYYPCYRCHNRHENHLFEAYPEYLEKDKVVYCGACQTELTINEYKGQSVCPRCSHPFNPNCKRHYHIYFKEK